MSEPLVSIIIPCYNTADFVGEAIDSALAQTYSPVEVIVIDDGSTDGSLDVIRAFGDRIRWETGPNQGACTARNRGLELADGELIQFLDADDLLDPNKIRRQRNLVASDRMRIPFSDSVVVAGGGQELDRYRPWYRDPFRQACFDRIQTAAPLHWKENLLAVGGFTAELPCSQERDLHLRLACSGFTFAYHPEVLVTVRRQPGSLSSDMLRVLDQHSGIVDRALAILDEREAVTDERLRALAGFLARDGRVYLKYGEPAKAAAAFSKARDVHPGRGLEFAYSPPTRILRRCVGPRITEQLVGWRRRFMSATEMTQCTPPETTIPQDDLRDDVEVFYLVNREALSSIFTAQVLVPISQHSEEIRMQLGVLTPLGHRVRRHWREKMAQLREQAVGSFGVKMTCFTASPTRWRWLWSDARIVRRWVAQQRQGEGPVVLHCRNASMTNVALDAARHLPGARVIFDSRGAEIAEFLQGHGLDITKKSDWPALQQQAFAELVAQQKRAVREADYVLCVSEAMRQDLVETNSLDPLNSSVVPCCPDVKRFHVSDDVRAATRAQLNLDRRLVVAYCGSMAWYQLPEESLRIFRLISERDPNARFLAITTQPDRMRQAMSVAGVSDDVATVVSVPPSDVPRYLAAADIGLLLRDQTIVNRVASPVKFGEYLAASVPVVITPNIGDYSREVQHRRLGCVVQLSSDDASIATELSRFLGSDEFLERQVHDRCAAYAVDHLEWKAHLNRIAAVYRELSSERMRCRSNSSSQSEGHPTLHSVTKSKAIK